MAKTYRIILEYTTTEDMSSGPDYWDWPELLDLDATRETFGLVSVARLPHVNDDHVQEIKKYLYGTSRYTLSQRHND